MADTKTNSQRYKRILLLAGPLIAAMISQNMLNLVDTYMIGKIGTAALAAVAAGGVINWLAGSAIMSLSTGVQQLAARRFGEEKHHATAFPLNAGLITAVVLGIPIGFICSYNAEHIMAFITNDKEVIKLGASYLSVTFLAVPFNGMNFCFRGYWSGVNKQKIYMMTLFFIHSLNIALNYCLIFGKWGFPELGVTGAALATMISISCGTVIYCTMAFVSLREHGFAQKFPAAVFQTLLKLSVPNAIQAFLYALSYTTLYKIIAVFGIKELAVSGVIINFALVCYLPGMALGLVATSLVGQSLGKNDPEDADLWARQTAKVAAIILGVLSLPFIFFPGPLLAAFIAEKETVAVGVTALSILGLSLSLEGVALVMQYALLGAGESRRVMFISTGVQWLFYLPIAWFMGYILDWQLNGVWAANILTQIVLFTIFNLLWLKGHWKNVKI